MNAYPDPYEGLSGELLLARKVELLGTRFEHPGATWDSLRSEIARTIRTLAAERDGAVAVLQFIDRYIADREDGRDPYLQIAYAAKMAAREGLAAIRRAAITATGERTLTADEATALAADPVEAGGVNELNPESEADHA